MSAPSIRLPTFQRHCITGALRMSNFTGCNSALAAPSARACSTMRPSSCSNVYCVSRLCGASRNASQPAGSSLPGLADENGVTSGADSSRCAWTARVGASARVPARRANTTAATEEEGCDTRRDRKARKGQWL